MSQTLSLGSITLPDMLSADDVRRIIREELGARVWRDDTALTCAEVCDILNCSESMLAKWERCRQLVPMRDGRWVRYLASDVAAFRDELRGAA